MPFTFSHPAAVLPLAFLPKRWFSMTGLVIGSMVPDFEYFIKMRVDSSYSHTWMGILWFNIPLSILLAFLFHTVVRNTLIDNLPPAYVKRFIVFKQFRWTEHFKRNVFIVLLSCFLGTMTHIVWDSFTHQHGHFVEAIVFLQDTFKFAGFEVPVYKVLQHTSTIIGGFFILYAVHRLPFITVFSKTNTQFVYWTCVTLITLIVIVFRLWIGRESNFIGNIIVTAITGGLVGLILTPAILRVKYNGR